MHQRGHWVPPRRAATRRSQAGVKLVCPAADQSSVHHKHPGPRSKLANPAGDNKGNQVLQGPGGGLLGIQPNRNEANDGEGGEAPVQRKGQGCNYDGAIQIPILRRFPLTKAVRNKIPVSGPHGGHPSLRNIQLCD